MRRLDDVRAAMFASLLMLGCAAPPAPSPGGVAVVQPSPARVAPAGVEGQLAARVNEHRRAAGLPELVYSDEIARVAREHSQAMAAGRADFGHDGMPARARALAARFGLTGFAENIARRGAPADVANNTLAGWLRSRVHRDNLEGNYQATGVGAATGPEGDVYLTQIFVRRGR